MKYFTLLALCFYALSSNASEISGICEEENTAASCVVINNTGEFVSHIEWLLEGSDFDYGSDAVVNLKNGEQTTISNEGDDNCLFTNYTWLIVKTESKRIDYFDDGGSDTIKFDEKGNCTIDLRKKL